MIKTNNCHYENYISFHEKQQKKTLFFLLFRIYFMTIKWQSRLIQSLIENLCMDIISLNKQKSYSGSIPSAGFIATNLITSYGGEVHYENKNIEICMYFPPDSIKEPSLIGSIEVPDNVQFYHSINNDGNRLAGPVVCLGPSGSSFMRGVKVTIPLPNGKLVRKMYRRIRLRFQVSQTKAGETPMWKPLDTHYMINWQQNTVTFNVKHFSVYKAIWNVLDVVLPETVKLHASSHISGLTFLTNFQVYMTDCRHKKQFGLCVVGSRDSNKSFEGFKEYPLEVGWCTPQRIRTGKVAIKLKSQLFKADESLGESAGELTKFIDYVGNDFDIQFLCVLNGQSTIPDVEMFGKVLICCLDDQWIETEECSFNLIKKQQSQTRQHIPVNRISNEVVEMLSTKGHTWKEFAVELGYSQTDIRCFSNKVEPIFELLKDFKSKGGSENDFLFKMHKVAAHINIDLHQSMKNVHHNKDCHGVNVVPGGKRTYNTAFHIDDKQKPDESQLDDIAGNIGEHWKKVGRKLNVEEKKLIEINLNYRDNSEKAFQMLLTWRERYPDQFTIDQGGINEDENQKENHQIWRSIHEGVVIEMDLEEGDNVVSEVFYSDENKNTKVKIHHKAAAQGEIPNYQTCNVDSTIYLKIEKLKDGDYIIEIHTKCIYTINVSVNKNFDNPANKIEEIGIATPGSNIKEYWEELTKIIFDPPMHEDSTVKFTYSNGASSMTKTQKLKEFEEIGAKYFKDNFVDKKLVVFPPFETIIDEYEQSVVNCFIEILKRRYTAERKGVVLVAPNIARLSEIINNTSSAKDNINYSKRKCLLVLVEKISLVLVVGIAMAKSDMREEIASVQNDVECFIKIHSHRIKEGLTIAGIIVCPSVEREVLTNRVPFQFADVDMELYETLFLCKDNIETERTFIKWWNRSISVLNRRLDIPHKASKGINFINIIGQHMVSMATVTDSLPTLSCNTHDKLVTLTLNKEQFTAINSPRTKKHIVGSFGSGKSLIGRTILKNLMGKLKHNGEPSTLFYISCDNNSVVDCHVKDSLEMLSDDTVQLVCGSLNQLYGEYINRQHSSFSVSLDKLMKGLAEKFQNPNFICDEVQSSVMTEHVAKAIDGYLQTILQQSHVVFIQQSMTKQREYRQKSIEADNFHLISGLELHYLQKVMRVAVDIQKLIFSAQEVIASHKSTVTVQKPESNTLRNTSRVQREMNPTISSQPEGISEETNISDNVDENSATEKSSNSTFEDLDASLKILSRSPQIKTTENAVTTKTTFFQGQEGNKIFSKKPLLIFLPEANDVDTVKILSFVLSNRCMQKTPVFIANSLQSAKLLNHGAKACTNETVVHIPYLQRKTPTTGQKNMAIKKDADSVLITDHKSFLGMEHEVVVSIIDPAEEIMRHSIVEIISRCTSYLYLFVLPQKGEATPGSMGEIITKWLEDDLVDTMSVEMEMNQDESEPFKIEGKKIIIYTKSEKFKSLSDEINFFSDAEFREYLPDEEMSKYLHNILREVEGDNEKVQSTFHEVTYGGKNWSFIDVYDLLINKDYATFREMFNHNRIILNYLRDEINNETFLMYASRWNRVHVVEHLTSEFIDDIDVWAVDKDRWNAYHVAVMADNVDVMKHLVSFDRSSLDVRDNEGNTPLHCAASYNSKRIVNLLLDAGASTDVVNNRGQTPDRLTDVDVEIKKRIQDHRKTSS